MLKKDKLYLLIFIFSINSIIASIVLKLLKINIFNVPNYNLEYSIIGALIYLVILLIQYIMIVGCVTGLTPKELFFKMLSFLPLTLILYYLPKEQYYFLTMLILFVTSLSLKPKFSTILSFIINIIFISLIQIAIIWLRLDIKGISPAFPNYFQFAIMNIDQLIILSLLYFANRKRGELYGMVISRRKK